MSWATRDEVMAGSKLVNYDSTPLPEWQPKAESVSAPAAP